MKLGTHDLRNNMHKTVEQILILIFLKFFYWDLVSGTAAVVTLQGDHCPDIVKFPDNSLTVHGTPAHVERYQYHAGTSVIVSGGGRNATVHDPKPKLNARTQQSQK